MELIIIALGAVACGYLIYRRTKAIRNAHWIEYQERSAARNERRKRSDGEAARQAQK